MSRFNHYSQMSVDDVIEYTLEKAGEIPWDHDSMETVVPSSHSDLNYMCRVWDGKGHSIYIKQTGTEARVSEDMKPSRDRDHLESEAPMLEDKSTPGMVSHVYLFDTIMCACGMEDCSDYAVMRDAMLRHETFPEFAEGVSISMINMLLLSSDIIMDHEDKREPVEKFVSPDLCDIIEKLVLMKPYNGLSSRNNVYAPNGDSVRGELHDDEALYLEVAKLKFRFMIDAQALSQGDLHIDSIFIRQDAIRIFDSEFGTCTSTGHDIGNVIANLAFAYDNGLSTNDTPSYGWILKIIEETVDLFIEEFSKKYGETVTESIAKVKGFKAWYFDGIFWDITGHAETELHCGTVGMANVTNVATITDEKKRPLAERINILTGKDYIMNRGPLRTGTDFVATVKRAKEAAGKTLWNRQHHTKLFLR